jgi:hypothetical protein
LIFALALLLPLFFSARTSPAMTHSGLPEAITSTPGLFRPLPQKFDAAVANHDDVPTHTKNYP